MFEVPENHVVLPRQDALRRAQAAATFLPDFIKSLSPALKRGFRLPKGTRIQDHALSLLREALAANEEELQKNAGSRYFADICTPKGVDGLIELARLEILLDKGGYRCTIFDVGYDILRNHLKHSGGTLDFLRLRQGFNDIGRTEHAT